MSRIGRLPINIPNGVKVDFKDGILKVEGSKGKLERTLRPEIVAKVDGSKLTVVPATGDSKELPRSVKAFFGMERALINNMINGVSAGFVKELDLIGVGYRADMTGNVLNLALGYSHTIDFPLPEGIKGSVIKEGREITVRLEGVDKQLVGQTAAEIRRLRKPEPYKGKGVRYKGEVIKLKAGKTGKK